MIDSGSQADVRRWSVALRNPLEKIAAEKTSIPFQTDHAEVLDGWDVEDGVALVGLKP